MPSQYRELDLLTAEIGLRVWGTAENFNGFFRLRFVTAATLLAGGQPNLARCLAISWAGRLPGIYTFLGAVAP